MTERECEMLFLELIRRLAAVLFRNKPEEVEE